jgi:hypothetical protein
MKCGLCQFKSQVSSTSLERLLMRIDTVALYLLSLQVGTALFAGLGVIGFIMLTNFYLTKKIAQSSQAMMSQKDIRVDMVDEMLRNYKLIKYFAWES